MSGKDKKDEPHEAEADAQPESGDEDRVASDLEDGVESLGRAMGGLMTRLFGEKITGKKLDPDKPVLSEDADRALDQVGDTLGRYLNAAGRSLKEHPTRPVKALDQTAKRSKETVEPRVGETALTEGLRSLAGGLYKTTEAVLDKVAPRKPKSQDPDGAEGEDHDVADAEHGEE